MPGGTNPRAPKVPSRTVVLGLEPDLFAAAANQVAQQTGRPATARTVFDRAVGRTWPAWSAACAASDSGAGRRASGGPGVSTNPPGTNCRRRPRRPVSRRRHCCAPACSGPQKPDTGYRDGCTAAAAVHQCAARAGRRGWPASSHGATAAAPAYRGYASVLQCRYRGQQPDRGGPGGPGGPVSGRPGESFERLYSNRTGSRVPRDPVPVSITVRPLGSVPRTGETGSARSARSARSAHCTPVPVGQRRPRCSLAYRVRP